MVSPPQSESFVRHLTEHQSRLFGYIYSLLGDHSRASDVLQETNLVLWRKIDEYDAQKAFLPWAFAIARFQVLAHLRDKHRDRMLLDAELAESLSGQVIEKASQIDETRLALRQCLQVLPDESRELIQRRYFRGQSVANVAEFANRSIGSVKVALMRIRRQLSDCIQQRVAAEVQS